MQAARPAQWPVPRLQASDEARVRLCEARPQEFGKARLAARDLRLSAEGGRRAAAGLALSDLGESRERARGGAIDARLDGERGRCGGARVPCGRARDLKLSWKPRFPYRSTSGR